MTFKLKGCAEEPTEFWLENIDGTIYVKAQRGDITCKVFRITPEGVGIPSLGIPNGLGLQVEDDFYSEFKVIRQ